MATIKNKPNTLQGIIGKEASDKIGTYHESTGGGTPIPKGEKLADHPEAERVQQPRDEEGKFTYNSANAKPLKFGPSRGTTVPPFLKGVKLNFAEKVEGQGIKTQYEGHIYLSDIKMNEAEFVETCKNYLEDGGGFKGLMGQLKAKKGARTKEEKQAISSNAEGIINNMKISAHHFTGYINAYKAQGKSFAGKKLNFAETGKETADISDNNGKISVVTSKKTIGKGIESKSNNGTGGSGVSVKKPNNNVGNKTVGAGNKVAGGNVAGAASVKPQVNTQAQPQQAQQAQPQQNQNPQPQQAKPSNGSGLSRTIEVKEGQKKADFYKENASEINDIHKTLMKDLSIDMNTDKNAKAIVFNTLMSGRYKTFGDAKKVLVNYFKKQQSQKQQ